jgi:hypothetical protein
MKKLLSNYDIWLKGQLTVNLPIIIIMLSTSSLFISVGFNFRFSIILGVVIGWFYWSFSVKKWIEWAIRNEISEDRLLKIGKRGLLIWNINTIKTVTEKNKPPII